jgi:hypothetical protein
MIQNIESAVNIIYLLGGLFSFTLVWCIRLEAKVLYLEKNAEENKLSIWQKLESFQGLLMELSQGVARIEGKLEK